MEIKIDELQVQEALDKQATASIKQAFEGYEIRSVMKDAIANSVIPALMTDAMVNAAAQIDVTKLAEKLAQEMTRAITKGVQAMVRDAMIEIIMRIKKIPEYDDKKREVARQEIIHEVFKS